MSHPFDTFYVLFTITKNVNLRDHKTLVSLWSKFLDAHKTFYVLGKISELATINGI